MFQSLYDFAVAYTYLVGVVIFGLFWTLIFLKKKVNRREMLIAGLFFGVASVLVGIKYSLADYWHPTYIYGLYIEDFLYGFFFAGICTQIYFFFFQTEERATKNRHPLFVLLALLISIFSFLVVIGFFKLNSIMALISAPLFVGIYVAYHNHRYLKAQLWSGLFATMITFVVFKILLFINPSFIENVYYVANLSGIMISGIPIEEYLFAFSLGFGLSLSYEYVFGKTLVFRKLKQS